MIDLAHIFRQVLDLWNSPAMTELSPEAFTDCANRCLSERFLDLDLTPDACFSTSKTDPFIFEDPKSREQCLECTLEDCDISRIIRVESRAATSTSEDDWEEEVVGSFENWNEIRERNDDNFVSFYRNPMSLTMVIARDPTSLQFRIVRKCLRDKIEVGDKIDLPHIYEPVIVYDLALEVGEVIDNQSAEFQKKKREKMAYLESRREDSLQRIDKWRRSQKGTQVTRRRAFNDRVPTFGPTGNRRFTVRF